MDMVKITRLMWYVSVALFLFSAFVVVGAFWVGAVGFLTGVWILSAIVWGLLVVAYRKDLDDFKILKKVDSLDDWVYDLESKLEELKGEVRKKETKR